MSDIVLYHGTSVPRWLSIQGDGWFQLPVSGDPKVSLTPDRAVAEYWADLASRTDASEGRGNGSIIIELSMIALDRAGYLLTEFCDDIWGENQCDWEQEIACWSPIALVDDVVLVAVRGQEAD